MRLSRSGSGLPMAPLNIRSLRGTPVAQACDFDLPAHLWLAKTRPSHFRRGIVIAYRVLGRSWV